MKYIQTYESFSKSYGQKMTQDEFQKIELDTPVLYKGTQFTVGENNGATIVLVPVKGGSPFMVNLSQFNQGGAISESFDSETLDEDAAGAMILMTSVALLLSTSAAITANGGYDLDASLKSWWNKWRKDRKVNKILDKLKDDPEVIEFLNQPDSQQRGKWQKFLDTKLTGEDREYLKSISRDRVKNGKI